MTKKIFAMFLAVLMVVSLLPTSVFAASCPGKDSPKHSTKNCDYTVVKVTEPTCGTAGHTSYKCNKCGYTFAEKTAEPTGEHNLVPGEGKAPTCVEPGKEAGVKCTECNYVKYGADIPALGKDGTDACEWEIVAGYDCDNEKGKIVEKCAFCGDVRETTREDWEEMLKEEYAKLGFVFVPMEDHEINWNKYYAISDTQGVFYCKGAGITGCSHYVIADVKNAHDCADYIYNVDRVEPTCTTNGMKAYDQCRVCNTKYGYVKSVGKYTYLTQKNIEDEYVIKAEHSYVDENGKAITATCADKLLLCGKCNKYVNPGIEHDVDWDNPDGEVQEATCLKPGYKYDKCANCQVKELKIEEATGHKEVTVTVPSTCGTYAYTFTYCTNDNCDVTKLSDLECDYANGVTTTVRDDYGFEYSVKVAPLAPTAKLSKGFLLGMVQGKLNKTLYFNGKTANYPYYLDTTTDASEAVTLYLEKLENFRDRYLMYFVDAEGVKTYVHMYKDGTYINVGLTTETPSTFWNWNAEMGTLVTYFGKVPYAMGTRNDKTYTTISAYNASQYPSNFKVQPYGPGTKAGVHLTSFTFDVEAGYNAENHDYAIEDGSVVLPTCTKAGSYDVVCGFCFDRVTVEMEAGCENHLNYYFALVQAGVAGLNPSFKVADVADLIAAGIKNTPAYHEATCTAGEYQYFMCTAEGCENVFKVTLSAPLGHHMTDWHDDTNALGHTKTSGYIGYDCHYCNYNIKLQTLSWKNANKLYDSLDKAALDHGHWKTNEAGDFLTEDDEVITLVKDADGKLVGFKIGTVYYNAEKADLSDYIVWVSDLKFVQNSKPGSCTVTGVDLYTCSVCKKNVRVRLWETIDGVDYPTGEHAGERLNHKNPSCDEAGYHTTYQCARCEAIIGNKGVNETETLEKLDHTYVEINALDDATLAYISALLKIELKRYEQAPCDKPNYNNVKYVCVDCLDLKGDGTVEHKHDNLDKVACEDDTIEVYTCHCGEVHIRAMGSYDHKWNRLPDVTAKDVEKNDKLTAADITYQAPTCYQYGWYTRQCEYCNKTEKKLVAPAEHVNEAGEKFTDSCLDEVTDRHCIVCCEVFKHEARFGNKHDCYEINNDNPYNPYYECKTVYHVCNDKCDDFCLKFIDDGCYVLSFCHKDLTEKRPSTCTQDAHILKICTDCGEEEMAAPMIKVDEDEYVNVNDNIIPAGTVDGDYVWFYGHMPIYNNDTLANYTYLDLKYQEVYLDKNDEFVYDWGYIFNAEFIEYVAPTFTEEGYAKFECQYCEAVVEQKLPKLSGIGFELDVKNANGYDEYTFGSLVEVIVSINGNDVDVNSFYFPVFSGFQYVGYETLNGDLFNITVSKPEVGMTSALISGVAANTAAGKMQNININGKTELVKLYFRISEMYGVDEDDNEYIIDEGNFFFLADEDICDVRQWIGGKDTVSVLNETILINETIDIELFMDFDNNGTASTSDLSLALMLLTGEHPDGLTYDVTVDMNKDGVITLEDLAIGHNLLVGNVDLEDVYLMGVDGAELDMYTENETFFCVHCGQAGITENTKYCPNCGRNPHAK